MINNFGIIKCGKEDFNKIDKVDIVGYRKSQFGYEVLINNMQRNRSKYDKYIIDSASLEDIMLLYIRR